MKTTSEQREAAFRSDLAELLARHGAEINITDDGRSYGMQSGVCIVTMGGVFDKEGDEVKEFTEFNL